MNESASQRDEVERLAEEFLERRRRGEHPKISDYANAHPELAAEIRELFPAIAFVDNMADSGELRPPKPAPMPESIGDYRLLREIGRGGMGVVYEAVQESLGRHVALKVLPYSALASPTYIERFRREARAAGQLHHTNIVPVFGVGEANGLQFYAMQYIHGAGLDTVLRTMQRQRGQAKTHPGVDATHGGPPLAKAESSGSAHLTSSTDAEYYRRVARIGVQVADALAYAHDQGVLHRDIKPANLLLDARDTVWITDFGLAKTEDDAGLTNTGDFVGTTRYMAPERFRGTGDPRSDVYSLGITLYELLTLRPAFVETDRSRLIDQVLHAEPPHPRQLERRIPRDLETIVLKAMAKEPRDRYATAAQMAEDLRRFVADRPIVARRTPLPERLWRWCRRNPGLATAASVAVAALLVISIGSPLLSLRLWEQRRQTQQELWTAQLARAEAARSTIQAGRRFDGLRALDAAHALIPSMSPTETQKLDLRNQFIASLSLADLGKVQEWDGCPPGCAGVCFDHQLERYARSDAKGNISVRRVADDHELALLPGEAHGAWTLHFSPDGKYLAAGYQQRFQRDALLFCIWDVDKREAIVRLKTTAGCGEVDFSPDSKRATYMKGVGKLVIRDLEDDKGQEQVLKLPQQPKHVAFHPDGTKLAVTLEQIVEVRSIDPWTVTDQWKHPAEVIGLAWRRDGKLLATACGYRIYLWEPGKKEPLAVLPGHEGLVTEVAFNHAGDLLASKGHDGTVRLWDVELRRQLVRTTSVFTGCSRMHFSPDDSRLGFASDGSKLWLWNVARGAECRTLEVRPPANWNSFAGCFSSDSRSIAVTGTDGLRIWNWSKGGPPDFVPLLDFASVSFAPDGTAFTTGEAGLQRWPLTGDGFKSSPTQVGAATPMQRAALSRDGRKLVACVAKDEGAIINLDKPDEPIEFEHKRLRFVAINHDGTLVATAPWYGDSVGVKVWDGVTGKIVRDLPAYASATVAFSPTGNQLTVATESEYRLYDTTSWEPKLRIAKYPEIGPGEASYAVTRSLLALRHSPTQLRLVDPKDGRLLAELQTPAQRSILWHTLSPDGQALAACCYGGVVHIWNLQLIRQQLAQRGLDW